MNIDILRGLRLKNLTPESVAYTASTDFDRILVKPVVKINLAHMAMLVKKGIVEREHGARCIKYLKDIPEDIILDPTLEDVHMNIEALLMYKVEHDSAGQLNLAKSRNDQVSTAIRMALRDYLQEIITAQSNICNVILNMASDHLDTLMPGYTHLQHAQPTTLAHHLLAYYDPLQRDAERLMQAFSRVNRSPLGAAALASSGLKIDRNFTASLLGFDGLVENSMDAVSSRDFAVEIVADLAIAMTNISRIAEELVLWSSHEFGIVEISDEYASTSSIMPQKKNAVVAELIRGKTSTVYGDMIASISIMKSLPYSYNIDMQQLTPHIWNACKITLSSLKVLTGMLRTLVFNSERLNGLLNDGLISATDLANYLTMTYGIPFRTAHTIVGGLARTSLDEKKPFRDVVLRDLLKKVKELTGKEISVMEKEIDCTLNPKSNVDSRNIIGGPSRVTVIKMIQKRRKYVQNILDWLSKQRIRQYEAEKELNKKVEELSGGEMS